MPLAMFAVAFVVHFAMVQDLRALMLSLQKWGALPPVCASYDAGVNEDCVPRRTDHWAPEIPQGADPPAICIVAAELEMEFLPKSGRRLWCDYL